MRGKLPRDKRGAPRSAGRRIGVAVGGLRGERRTVLVDGKPVLSCLVLGFEAQGRDIRTIEGVADGPNLHPLQDAFANLNASQGGSCSAGIILTAKQLLESNPKPTRDEIKAALGGNICRCTGCLKIFEAVELAAARCRGEDAEPSKETLDGS